MNLISVVLLNLFLIAISAAQEENDLFQCRNGVAYFISEAPLETIEARSDALQGIIKPRTGEFAFSLLIRSFNGFNSPLQQEHFNEKYMQSHLYPRSTFQGTIIDGIDMQATGPYDVRAKGTLSIHGIEQERIIRASLEIKEDTIFVNAVFTVLLDDHDISIPKIVHQKIAEEIRVEVDASFLK